MFAYCLNNPVNRVDFSGNMSEKKRINLSHNVCFQAEMYGGAAAAILIPAVIVNTIDQTSTARLIEGIEEIFSFAKRARTTEEQLTDIALKHGHGYCDTAAKDMERYLKKKGEDYKVLKLIDIYGSGLIYSISRGINVATNGYHMGVLYNGNAYCTIHPYGIPFSSWKEDFVGEVGFLKLVTWP